MTNFAPHFNVCSPKLGNDGAFHSHLAMRLATVADGYAVLIHLLYLQTRRQLTLATKRQIWHG